jgi:hypothetical protein
MKVKMKEVGKKVKLKEREREIGRRLVCSGFRDTIVIATHVQRKRIG